MAELFGPIGSTLGGTTASTLGSPSALMGLFGGHPGTFIGSQAARGGMSELEKMLLMSMLNQGQEGLFGGAPQEGSGTPRFPGITSGPFGSAAQQAMQYLLRSQFVG